MARIWWRALGSVHWRGFLKLLVPWGWDTQWALLSMSLRDVDPSDRGRLTLLVLQESYQFLDAFLTESIQSFPIRTRSHVALFALQAFVSHDVERGVAKQAVLSQG